METLQSSAGPMTTQTLGRRGSLLANNGIWTQQGSKLVGTGAAGNAYSPAATYGANVWFQLTGIFPGGPAQVNVWLNGIPLDNPMCRGAPPCTTTTFGAPMERYPRVARYFDPSYHPQTAIFAAQLGVVIEYRTLPLVALSV
jgi:hypothetical protein